MIYVSPQDEARSLRRAAARSGCHVRDLTIGETSAGTRAMGRVECRDGWAAAAMLLASAIEDSQTPGARDIALQLRRGAPSDESFARAVHAFVKEHVAFVREAGEVFQGLDYTLASGGGDCDDHARAVYAIAVAGGLPAALAFLHNGGPRSSPTHAVAQLCTGGRCSWAETTIDAHFGEHPLDAARRFGLISQRQDLAEEVRIMTEKDLPPVPDGFSQVNPIDVLRRDATALFELGFLQGLADVHCDPMAYGSFREAVREFQVRNPPLVVDGLCGPKTRAALVRKLEPSHARDLGYAMGGLGDAKLSGPSDHVNAAPVIREAWTKVHGRSPTENEQILTQAIASLETGYGRWPGQHAENAARGNYNWGNIERARTSFDAPCPSEPRADGGRWIPGVDAGKPVCFLAYSTDVDAAASFVRTLTKRHWPVIGAMTGGDPADVARAMKTSPAYYSADEQGYADGMRARARDIVRALGLHPLRSGTIGGPVIAFLGFSLAAAVGAYLASKA